MTEIRHKVSLRAGGQVIENWTSYDIQNDLLTPADAFTLQLGPADPLGDEFGDVWAAVRPDAAVEVQLDDVTICSGIIDDRLGDSSMDADIITVNGRDRTGRLLDESMPLISFSGLGLEELAKQVAGPWFSAISFSNAVDRALRLGKGRGAKGGKVFKEPEIPRSARAYRKVEPGETRWGVLSYFCRECEVLAWSAADGKTLVIGRPNYDQEATFSFFHARAGSRRAAEANCLTFRTRDSVGERYSQIVAMGANAGSARNYGERVVKRRGVASNGPDAYGTGADFIHRKVLLVADDAIQDDKQAKTRAEREMAERDAGGAEITVTVAGHAQQLAGARAPTIYACDTMAYVESEVYGVKGLYLITSARFRRDRRSGETTEIRLVPKGTVLKA